MSVSRRVSKVGVSPTMRVAAKAKEMKAEGHKVIDLSVGEPDFPTPQNIRDAAKRAIDDGFTKYTINAGIPELRQAISDKLKNDNGLEYGINDIIVSSGAKQCVYNAIQSTIYVDEEVIIPAPYWVSYPHMVKLAHGEPVILQTLEEDGFKLKPEELEEAVTDYTKLLILCNPSNPTGAAYTKEEMEALAEVSLKHNFYILADEIYEKLVYDKFEFVSFATLHPELKKRTIVINGVSKAYSMTGWRIGYTAGPEHIIKGINKLQSHSTSNASSVSQYAALEALTGPQDAVEEMRREFEARRNYLHGELNKIEGITCNMPEGAFYLFPNVTGVFGGKTDVLKVEHSFDLAMFLLYEAKLAVVPGSSFGAEGYLRVSYATSMDELKEAVERIKEALSKLR